MSRAPLTLNGAQRLRDELDQLKSVKRPEIINALRMLATKREARPAKRHGNIPL